MALALLLALFGVYSALIDQANTANLTKFKIGLVGTAEHNFLQMGMAALQSFDSSRFAMEVQDMTEPEAETALAQGTIAAYVVIPSGFMEEALAGNIIPLKFVSTTGAAGLVSIFKDEVTAVVSDIVLCSQRGTFGMAELLREYELTYKLGKKMDDLALKYVDYLLVRGKTYQVQELGIADRLGLEEYLLCGVCVLFLLLVCLPFAPLMIRRDQALSKMLCARGHGAVKQALCDFAGYFLTMLMMLILLVALIALVYPQLTELLSPWTLLWRGLSIVAMTATFSFLLYTLARDLIGGVLLQFFMTLSICFVSGCMYPPYFFPVQVQKLGAWLPTGLARIQLSTCLTGEAGSQGLWLLGYSGLFLTLAILIRIRRLKEVA